MIRLGLTNDQLATTRFVVSPLAQLVTAVVRLRSAPERVPQWVRRGWAATPAASRAALEHLVDPTTHYMPDFLAPVPRCDRPTLTDQLDDVRATPVELVRAELRRYVRLGEVDPDYAQVHRWSGADVAAWRKEPHELEVKAWAGEPGPLLDWAATALHETWSAMFAPMWPVVRDVLEADILHRSRVIARDGVSAAVLDLVEGQRADGETVLIESPLDLDVRCHRGRVLLAPDVMVEAPGGVGIMYGADDRLLLAYPCRGRGLVGAPTADPDLAVVVGGTRQRLLTALAEPASGSHLAVTLCLTPPTVSYHLARLHRAGLVDRRRVGKQVVWSRSTSGEHLVAH